MSKTWYTTFAVLLVTSLVACSAKTVIIEQKIVEECTVITCETSFDAFSWIDSNADGAYDNGESPLPGVKFTAYMGREELRKISYPLHTPTVSPNWLSNQDGITHFYVYHTGVAPDCKDACDTSRKAIVKSIVVKARVPRGYRLTTPRKQSIEDGLNFGFVRVLGLKQR